MTCHQARQQLAAYRRDDWTATDMRALADHLASCASCRQIEAQYRRVGESLRLLPTITPSASFRESVFAAIAAEQRKLGPAAMRASRAETEPSLPVVRAPITPIRSRRAPQPVMRAALAIAAVLALALFATQFLPDLATSGLTANFFRGASSLSTPVVALTPGVYMRPSHVPFSAAQFSSSSVYQGKVGAQWLFVYAGEAWTSDSTHQGYGALRIYDSHQTLLGVYAAPGAAHTLTIASAQGDVLHLSADSGATLIFNLTTRAFSA